MDFKSVVITQEDGVFYAITETAKYELSNPSDSSYFHGIQNVNHRAKIGNVFH